MMGFGKILVQLRGDKTQEQVAKNLGVSVQTYCAWEKSIANVAVSKVSAVASYFGVKLGEIFLD